MGERAKTLDQILAGHAEVQKEHGREVKALVKVLTQEAIEIGLFQKYDPEEFISHQVIRGGRGNLVMTVMIAEDRNRYSFTSKHLGLTSDGEIHQVRAYTFHTWVSKWEDQEFTVDIGKELDNEQYLSEEAKRLVRRLQEVIEREKR